VVNAANTAALSMRNIIISANAFANNNNVFDGVSCETLTPSSGAVAYSANSALVWCSGQQNEFVGLRYESAGGEELQQMIYYGAAARDNRIYGGRGPLGLSNHFGNYIKDVNATTTPNRLIGWDRRGCRVRLAGTQSLADTTITVIDFDNLDFDTSGFYDSGTPSRITIPADRGIKRVRLKAKLALAGLPTGETRLIMYKNGSVLTGGGRIQCSSARYLMAESAVISVSDGDIFEIAGYQTSGGAINATDDTFLEIEVLEG
jgi:hypothetical protein